MTRRRPQATPIPDEPGFYGVTEALLGFVVILISGVAFWLWLALVTP